MLFAKKNTICGIVHRIIKPLSVPKNVKINGMSIRYGNILGLRNRGSVKWIIGKVIVGCSVLNVKSKLGVLWLRLL